MPTKPHLSRRAQRQWMAYIRQLADLMGLKDKRFYVQLEPPESKDAAATIDCIHGSSLSNIRLGVAFIESTPEHQREYVCHELIHAHFAAPDCVVEKELTEVVYPHWEMCMEYAVDAIAA